MVKCTEPELTGLSMGEAISPADTSTTSPVLYVMLYVPNGFINYQYSKLHAS